MVLKKIILMLPLGTRLYRVLARLRGNYIVWRDRRNLQRFGFEVIRKVDRALAGRMQYLVAYGTLLGLVRDGGFIKHDDDLDFCLIVKGGGVAPLIRNLEEQGILFSFAYEYQNKIEQLVFSYKKLRIDFFFLRSDDESSWVTSFYHVDGVAYPEPRYLTPFKVYTCKVRGVRRMVVQGVEFNVPENYEEFLVADYGENWRIPDSSWSLGSTSKYPRLTLPGYGYGLVGRERVMELDKGK